MCCLIHCAIDHKLTPTYLEMAEKTDFSIEECKNISIIKMAPEMRFYNITDGMCSCGLYSRPVGQKDFEAIKRGEEFVKERLIRRYNRKKWSEGKIHRAIDNIYENSQSCKRLFSGLRPDVWNYLVSLVILNGTVGLLIHQFKEGFDSERVAVVKQVKASIDTLKSHTFEEDTFYIIARPEYTMI